MKPDRTRSTSAELSHRSLQRPHKLQPTTIPTFQMRKITRKEIKRPALGHTDCWQIVESQWILSLIWVHNPQPWRQESTVSSPSPPHSRPYSRKSLMKLFKETIFFNSRGKKWKVRKMEKKKNQMCICTHGREPIPLHLGSLCNFILKVKHLFK